MFDMTFYAKAEEIFHQESDRNHEYLPIAGLLEFVSAAQKIILGEDSPALREGRVRDAWFCNCFIDSSHKIPGMFAPNRLWHRRCSSRSKLHIEIPKSTDTFDLPLRSKLAEPLPDL
jgi:hypothetical protein